MLLSEHTNIINMITTASDTRLFCLGEGDFSSATVCVTAPSMSLNLVIRLACCVIVTYPHQHRVLRAKEK